MMSGKALGHKTHKREFSQIYIHFTCIRILKQKTKTRNEIELKFKLHTISSENRAELLT